MVIGEFNFFSFFQFPGKEIGKISFEALKDSISTDVLLTALVSDTEFYVQQNGVKGKYVFDN